MPSEIGGVPLKDLLQLGFSFFVAGYLLVKDWKLSSKVTTLLEVQSERMGQITQAQSDISKSQVQQTELMGRMERLIERVWERQLKAGERQ